jgi:uncharacterized membrane protein (DUF485 family)
MELKKMFNKFKTPIEILLGILFTLFLVFPVKLPKWIATQVESPLGIIILFCISVLLFLHTNIILATYFLLFVYELIRRSSILSRPAFIDYTPTNERKNDFIHSVTVPQKTLEEDIVSQMAPIGVSNTGNGFIETDFKPISDDIHNASNI